MRNHDEDTVLAAERQLLNPEIRSDAAAVRALLHPDFREVGVSGTVWNRETITQATQESAVQIDMEDVRIVSLGPDAILLTYLARLSTMASLRTSIWFRDSGDWRLLHHQGTHTTTNVTIPEDTAQTR